jgi:hypothetical protein
MLPACWSITFLRRLISTGARIRFSARTIADNPAERGGYRSGVKYFFDLAVQIRFMTPSAPLVQKAYQGGNNVVGCSSVAKNCFEGYELTERIVLQRAIMHLKPFALDALAVKIRAMIENGDGEGTPPR